MEIFKPLQETRQQSQNLLRKNELLPNLESRCFFCLRIKESPPEFSNLTPTPSNSQENYQNQSENGGSHQLALWNIFKFLKINVGEIKNMENFPTVKLEPTECPESQSETENKRWKADKTSAEVDVPKVTVPVCENCWKLGNSFMELYRTLEVIQLRLEESVRKIFKVMTEADEPQLLAHCQGYLEETTKLTRILRKKTIEKCGQKISSSIPRVKVNRLTEKQLEEIRAKGELRLEAERNSSYSDCDNEPMDHLESVSSLVPANELELESSSETIKIKVEINNLEELHSQPNSSNPKSCPYCRAKLENNLAFNHHLLLFHCEYYFPQVKLEGISTDTFKRIVSSSLFQDFLLNPYKCFICQKTFPSLGSGSNTTPTTSNEVLDHLSPNFLPLKMHLVQYHHPILTKKLEEIQKDPKLEETLSLDSNPEIFRCGCGVYTATKQSRLQHLSSYCFLIADWTKLKSDSRITFSSIRKKIPCRECGKLIQYRHEPGHLRLECPGPGGKSTLEKKKKLIFLCTLCGVKIHPSRLFSHLKLRCKNPEAQSYIKRGSKVNCNFCRKLIQPGEMYTHILCNCTNAGNYSGSGSFKKKKSEAEAKTKCLECGKIFKNLEKHQSLGICAGGKSNEPVEKKEEEGLESLEESRKDMMNIVVKQEKDESEPEEEKEGDVDCGSGRDVEVPNVDKVKSSNSDLESEQEEDEDEDDDEEEKDRDTPPSSPNPKHKKKPMKRYHCPHCRDVIKSDGRERLKKHIVLYHSETYFPNLKKDCVTQEHFQRIVDDLLFKEFVKFGDSKCPLCGDTFSIKEKSHRHTTLKLHLIRRHYKTLAEKLKEIQNDPEVESKLFLSNPEGIFCPCGMYLANKRKLSHHQIHQCKVHKRDPLPKVNGNQKRKVPKAPNPKILGKPYDPLQTPAVNLRNEARYDPESIARNMPKVKCTKCGDMLSLLVLNQHKIVCKGIKQELH